VVAAFDDPPPADMFESVERQWSTNPDLGTEGLDIDLELGARGWRITDTLNRVGLGEASRLKSARLHLVNFVDWEIPRPFHAGPWQITISQTSANPGEAIDEAGGFGVTHTLDIESVDGSLFQWEDTSGLRDAIFHWCSFVKGALVGWVLPEGFDEHQERVFVEWSATTVSRWRSRLAWSDPSCAVEVSALLDAWLRLASDDFWKEVLSRAARIAVSANEPDPLDVAIPTALTGLELLAWAVLVVREGWVRPGEQEMTAAAMIRLLMRWAEIPTDLPSQLTHLSSYIEGDGADLPMAVTQVRNRLVHPPRKATSDRRWPPSDVLTDAWRSSLEMLDLSLLRVLGYEGDYVHRRHLDGYWLGDTDPVPWSAGASLGD